MKGKRLLTMCLALVMIMTMFSSTAFAYGRDGGDFGHKGSKNRYSQETPPKETEKLDVETKTAETETVETIVETTVKEQETARGGSSCGGD